CCDFALLGRHDQLAAARKVHTMAFEEGVERTATFDTEPRFERAGGVMQAGVNDFGIARRNSASDAILPLQHSDAPAAFDQRVSAGEPDNAGADHNRVKIRHTPSFRSVVSRQATNDRLIQIQADRDTLTTKGGGRVSLLS